METNKGVNCSLAWFPVDRVPGSQRPNCLSNWRSVGLLANFFQN
jgi:hypothetical protein